MVSPEKKKEYAAKDYLKNKDKYMIRSKLTYQKNKEKLRDLTYQRKFGITIDEYNTLFEIQKGVCKICNNPETKVNRKSTGLVKRLAVDHCHKTGKVRGLLCQDCNVGLGAFKDNTELIKRAIDYLQEVV